MKKVITVFVTSALLAGVCSGIHGAAAAASTVTGRIVVPAAPTVAGPSEQAAACALESGGPSSQGIFGWVIPVTPGALYTLGGASAVPRPVPIGQQPHSAFAIGFYSKAPTCDDVGELVSRHRGSGTGLVPAAAVTGIVTYEAAIDHGLTLSIYCGWSVCPGWTGAVGVGAGPSFTYRESPPSTTTTTTTKPKCRGKC